MRVLLDENIPHDLIPQLAGPAVLTVQGLGWAGVENGDLLRRAHGQVEAFITTDRKLEHQNDLSVLPFGVVVVRARSNRVPDVLLLVGQILKALERIAPGTIEQVGAS